MAGHYPAEQVQAFRVLAAAQDKDVQQLLAEGINYIFERYRADAKAKGVKFGRKPKLTPHQMREAIQRRDKDGETLRSIARSYNVSAATIQRLSA